MARRRADKGSFTFDLEPDADAAPPVSPGDAAPAHGASPTWFERALAPAARRVRSWPRRRVIAGGVAFLVVVAGTVGAREAVSQAREREWARIAASAPGAVLDLSHEPAELWRVSLVRPTLLGVVDGTMVLQEMPATGEDTAALTGVDPVTGDVAWRTAIPDTFDCRVSESSSWMVPDGRVTRGTATVCFAPDRDSVVVVGADGTLVAERDLADVVDHADDEQDGVGVDGDDGSQGRVLVTPDAVLVRIDYLGDPAPLQAVAEPASDTAPDTAQGAENPAIRLTAPLVTRDVRVRAEDAATGEVRWQVTLDGATFPVGSTVPEMSGCLMSQDADGTFADPESYWSATLGATRLWLTQCGLGVVLDLATGAVVQQEDVTALDYGRGEAIPLVDGGWSEITVDSAGSTWDVVSRIKRADGTDIGSLPGVVPPLLATDGPRSALLLTSAWWSDGGQEEVAAYDAATLEREWSRSLPRVRPVARTRDVVVVTDGATVTGLDRETGRTLWSAQLDLPDRELRSRRSRASDRITDTLTDGHRVMVARQVDPEGYGVTGNLMVMTTFDLTTGEVVWSTPPGSLLYAIGGRLFRVGTNVLVALG